MATSATTETSKNASYSVQQRERGNTFYNSATDNFGCTIRLLRLDNALTCYRNALDWKSNEDEEVSAMKNIGMTSWKLASVYFESARIKEAKNIRKYFKEALKYFGLAYKNGFCKSLPWRYELEDSWRDCLTEAKEWLDTLDATERKAGFSELLSYVPDCRLKAEGYLQLSMLLYFDGLTSWENCEYKECHRYMKECSSPIQEADRLSSQYPSIKTIVSALREDVCIRTSTAESIMARVPEGPKAKTSTSLSRLGREFGNNYFRSARDERSNTLKSIKLKGALQFYTIAYFLSCRDEDLVSAAKNAATTNWRLAELMKETGSASDEKAIHDYFKDALQYFSKAYPKRNCRGQAWATHLEKAMQDCLDDIRTWIAPKDEDDRIASLTEYLGYLPACGAKANGYLSIANIYLKRGKEALKVDEYENCQGYLKECRVPLGEAEKMCTNVDPSIQLSVDGFKKSVEYHEGLVKRYIARVKDVEAREQREQAEESAKKIAMDQLKVDISTLDLFTELPVEDFVKQVYLVWPPKGSESLNPPSSSSSSSSAASEKKLLIRAIGHYHPDKADKNVHGIKWHLLSCEITKYLNMRLAKIKSDK